MKSSGHRGNTHYILAVIDEQVSMMAEMGLAMIVPPGLTTGSALSSFLINICLYTCLRLQLKSP